MKSFQSQELLKDILKNAQERTMESDGLGMIVLGIFGVLMFISIVFLPLGILTWYLTVGKKFREQHQREQQQARERLTTKGIVKADKWC